MRIDAAIAAGLLPFPASEPQVGARAGTDAQRIGAELAARIAGVHRVVETELAALQTAARDRWPVRTGRSRDALSVRVVESGGVVVGELRNSAPYAGYIRWNASQPRGTVAAELLFARVDELADACAQGIADQLVQP